MWGEADSGSGTLRYHRATPGVAGRRGSRYKSWVQVPEVRIELFYPIVQTSSTPVRGYLVLAAELRPQPEPEIPTVGRASPRPVPCDADESVYLPPDSLMVSFCEYFAQTMAQRYQARRGGGGETGQVGENGTSLNSDSLAPKSHASSVTACPQGAMSSQPSISVTSPFISPLAALPLVEPDLGAAQEASLR